MGCATLAHDPKTAAAAAADLQQGGTQTMRSSSYEFPRTRRPNAAPICAGTRQGRRVRRRVRPVFWLAWRRHSGRLAQRCDGVSDSGTRSPRGDEHWEIAQEVMMIMMLVVVMMMLVVLVVVMRLML
eukprot:2330993-Pyramimonas_sp.AAC.1